MRGVLAVARSIATRLELASLEAPANAAAHALFQRDHRAVVQLGLRPGHRARDRLVHFGQDMELLLVGPERLNRGVHELGDVAGDGWQAKPPMCALLAEFALEQTL